MMPTVMKAERPPFVRWEERECGVKWEPVPLEPGVELAEGQEPEKRPIPIIKWFALITPVGSKDVIEQYAEPWLKGLKEKALKGEYPIEWANLFAEQFKAFKEGNELPRTGTPIKTWSMITINEQRVRLIALGITTVEDLDQWPDAALGQIGLDGRYLRDLARGWLKEVRTVGSSAKELADAKADVVRLTEQAERQQSTIDRLSARLDALERGGGDESAPPEQEQPRARRRAAAGA